MEHHTDDIRILDGTQSMRDDQGGAILFKERERVT